ncbi:hypothetical protein [Curtobacterium sp. Leaf261]|uniref:hypothetical protein n=1 Tax=Curtobacterium sp. Leaf261 TaxID=1736311 RepID=UPI0006F44487|nr:hypothetical protein [Curtobacterium sp. Leaf261]KQO62679.1 hypothetical protein ASF23_06845 [Curtobacterium sp. Leaf261]
MRWRAGYEQDDGDAPAYALIEAATRDEAFERLREVVGSATPVVFMVPDEQVADVLQGETYEHFLHDPGSDRDPTA